MKIQKVLLAIRHTKKGGPSEFDPATNLPDSYIGATGRECIKAIKLPSEFTDYHVDLFGSGIARTHQELVSLTAINCLDSEVHDPLLNMGTDELFTAWMAGGLKQAATDAGSNIKGLEKILCGEAFYRACRACADDILKAMQSMHFAFGLGVFHTPTIEMAAHAMKHAYSANLAEDTGMIFVLDEGMAVHYYGPWSSGDPIPAIEQ